MHTIRREAPLRRTHDRLTKFIRVRRHISGGV